MAKTAKGIVKDSEELDKILYVSQDRLEALKKKLKSGKGKGITAKDVQELMYPEDLDDDKVLVPVDISSAGPDFPTTHEEVLEKVSPQEAVEAIVQAEKAFATSSKKFKKDDRPIPMSVGEWMTAMGLQDMAEENGEEEELEGDEEEEPEDEEEEEPEAPAPASKKRRTG
mmetsp:Transcript_71952/g.181522  ORF Transcript_71952/g.181522 Transcript_71952/m.181522 type:complete len:170 (-) Transcript_71952:316-825(-)